MVVTPGTPSAATPKDIHMKVRAGVPSVTNALPTMFQAQPNVTVISVKSTYAGPTELKLQETKHPKRPSTGWAEKVDTPIKIKKTSRISSIVTMKPSFGIVNRVQTMKSGSG
eukprot:834871_1